MRAIVIGCGRMGSGLAEALARRSFQITVVDADAAAFERLGADFPVKRVVGVGFDRDVLLEAGIERADALAAVTASDDVNIVTARVARHIFHVPRVVARVNDPRNEWLFTDAWGVDVAVSTPRMLASLIEAAGLFGFNVRAGVPQGYEPDARFVEAARAEIRIQ